MKSVAKGYTRAEFERVELDGCEFDIVVDYAAACVDDFDIIEVKSVGGYGVPCSLRGLKIGEPLERWVDRHHAGVIIELAQNHLAEHREDWRWDS